MRLHKLDPHLPRQLEAGNRKFVEADNNRRAVRELRKTLKALLDANPHNAGWSVITSDAETILRETTPRKLRGE